MGRGDGSSRAASAIGGEQLLYGRRGRGPAVAGAKPRPRPSLRTLHSLSDAEIEQFFSEYPGQHAKLLEAARELRLTDAAAARAACAKLLKPVMKAAADKLRERAHERLRLALEPLADLGKEQRAEAFVSLDPSHPLRVAAGCSEPPRAEELDQLEAAIARQSGEQPDTLQALADAAGRSFTGGAASATNKIALAQTTETALASIHSRQSNADVAFAGSLRGWISSYLRPYGPEPEKLARTLIQLPEQAPAEQIQIQDPFLLNSTYAPLRAVLQQLRPVFELAGNEEGRRFPLAGSLNASNQELLEQIDELKQAGSSMPWRRPSALRDDQPATPARGRPSQFPEDELAASALARHVAAASGLSPAQAARKLATSARWMRALERDLRLCRRSELANDGGLGIALWRMAAGHMLSDDYAYPR